MKLYLAGILDFESETLVCFDLHVTPMIPPSFKSIGLSVQEKKQKMDFQDGHLFPIGMILAIFDQVTPMLPLKF